MMLRVDFLLDDTDSVRDMRLYSITEEIRDKRLYALIEKIGDRGFMPLPWKNSGTRG